MHATISVGFFFVRREGGNDALLVQCHFLTKGMRYIRHSRRKEGLDIIQDLSL